MRTSADATIFSKQFLIYCLAMKIKNSPQKMLIIGPKRFFFNSTGSPNQPKIDFSYHKHIPSHLVQLKGITFPDEKVFKI